VLVEGQCGARVLKYGDRTDYYEAEAVVLADEMGEKSRRGDGTLFINEFESYVKLNKKIPGGRWRRSSDRGLRQARRQLDIAPCHQDSRQAGDPRTVS